MKFIFYTEITHTHMHALCFIQKENDFTEFSFHTKTTHAHMYTLYFIQKENDSTEK